MHALFILCTGNQNFYDQKIELLVQTLPTSSSSANSSSGVHVDFEVLKGTKLHASSSKIPAGKQRTSHNLVEKKYRHSIDDKINELRRIVPDKGIRKVTFLAVLLI